jgi:hypothetical protein
MALLKLSLTTHQLSQEYVLVQAWKKAHDYIRRHNWYSDVLELDIINADLEFRLDALSQNLRSSELQPNLLRLVLAPKIQHWVLKNDKWAPAKVKGNRIEDRLRPLAHLTARDQIIGTAFMMLLADTVETKQGDPRRPAMKAREHNMVSYGHRLFCDDENGQLRFRWGNAVVYRQYFQDYQTFVARPQEVVDVVFDDSKDWAIVYADLSQFYDRVRPAALYNKVEKLVNPNPDVEFLGKFRRFFNWEWHHADREESRNYAKRAKIDGFDRVALPQGLVASGFFANAFLIDFDEALCSEFDQWHDEERWQLVDFCRYVDDMRIVIRLGDKLRDAKEPEIIELVSKHLQRLLHTHAEGLIVNPKKCSIVLGRNAAAGSIRVSVAMKRINHNTSGPIDLIVGGETIDLIEGLFLSRQEEPLNFEEKFRDTFFAAKPDVRDETVARCAANRFRQTYRSLRPLCEDDPETSDESLLPDLSRDVLDSKAIHFCRRLIERWVRDPSNMRLLRVALDVCPDPTALNVVLDVLKQYIDANSKRQTAMQRVAWYCGAELLKAGATETGLVTDEDCLPAGIDLRRYQEILADFAEQITTQRNTYPWYLEQQAHLFLACFGRALDPRYRPGTSAYLKDYVRLRQTLAGRQNDLRIEEVVPFVLLQKHLQDIQSAARTFLSCFREKPTSIQRKLLRRVIQDDASLAETIHNEMTSDEQHAWRVVFQVHGIMSSGGFPETLDALPVTETIFSFLSVTQSSNNPFQQEYAALHFALALLKRLQEKLGLLFPSRIKIRAKDWRSLCNDRFPIDEGAISVEVDGAAENDVRFAIPDWVKKQNRWKYQLGQILRVILTGIPDFTESQRRPPRDRSHVLYLPVSSSWMRRRYGIFNGRNAFGPPWLPISSWLGSLLSRLLEWPGFARFDFDFELREDFDMPDLVRLITRRVRDLDRLYGRASRTPVIPVLIPKKFMRPNWSDAVRAVSLRTMRVGVVQTVIPRTAEFVGDPGQNAPATRRRHRRHLSAVLGGVHRMLQVRETHRENGSGIELLVFPELSVHPRDITSHLLPFVNQHRCMVFAGIVFHPAAGRPLVNTGYWIIPVTRPLGLQIQVIEQGKLNLTAEELALHVSPFRPAQWMLRFVDPVNQNLLWSMSGSICYDSTDLRLAADLRDLTDMYVVPSLNKDVGTFDNMAAALHYHMFQHMIVANTGEFGGSTGQAPFDDRHKRTIFHTHGNEQVSSLPPWSIRASLRRPPFQSGFVSWTRNLHSLIPNSSPRPTTPSGSPSLAVETG